MQMWNWDHKHTRIHNTHAGKFHPENLGEAFDLGEGEGQWVYTLIAYLQIYDVNKI